MYFFDITKILCIFVMYLKRYVPMDKKNEEILLISQKLTEYKLRLKMLEWTFEVGTNLPPDKMNAILDEKNRLDRYIKSLENRLEQLK